MSVLVCKHHKVMFRSVSICLALILLKHVLCYVATFVPFEQHETLKNTLKIIEFVVDMSYYLLLIMYLMN